jgi:RNA polymerase sigma factor (sigma-70 family)
MPDLDRFDGSRHLYHDDPPESEARARLHEALRHAVTTALTDKQREAVEAHFFEGLSQGEIARRLGVSQQVIQKRIYGAGRSGKTVGGALRKLREALQPLVAREAER